MQFDKTKVTILIVVKNEAEGLARIINSVKPYAADVIVVDGHSQDNTKEIAKKENVRYFLDNGLGRGDGIRVGITKASKEIIVFFDADGSHEAEDIPKLVSPLLEKKADLVIGSRRTGGSFDLNMNFAGILRSAGVDLMAYFLNKRFGTKFSDILYSFRAIKRPVALNLNLRSNGFSIEQEMIISCLKKGFIVLEVPSREKARAWGKSKLKTISGIKMLFLLLKDLYL